MKKVKKIKVDATIDLIEWEHNEWKITVYGVHPSGVKYTAITNDSVLVADYQQNEPHTKKSHNAGLKLLEYCMHRNDIVDFEAV